MSGRHAGDGDLALGGGAMARSGIGADDWIVHSDASRSLGLGAGLCLVAAGLVFTLFPKMDLAASALFFDTEHGSFVGNTAQFETLREIFKVVYIATSVLALAGFAAAQFVARRWLGLDPAKWLFLCLCLLTGPGIVSNLALKDQWGRARPKQIVEFAGDKIFTPALAPAKQCDKNCSFVSGEASSIYMVFFATSFLFRRRTKQLVVAGIIAGSIAGLIRMSQGGHFVSDVVFAGIAMAMTATALHQLFFVVATAGPGPEPAATNSGDMHLPAPGI